jgi:hypothetical protein
MEPSISLEPSFSFFVIVLVLGAKASRMRNGATERGSVTATDAREATGDSRRYPPSIGSPLS